MSLVKTELHRQQYGSGSPPDESVITLAIVGLIVIVTIIGEGLVALIQQLQSFIHAFNHAPKTQAKLLPASVTLQQALPAAEATPLAGQPAGAPGKPKRRRGRPRKLKADPAQGGLLIT